MIRLKEGFINYITLFGSMSTLICCALPSFLVSLGLGAVMAGLASNVPGLIWISEHKSGVFIFAGLMLLVNGIILWQNRNAPCPTDPKLRDTCLKSRKTGSYVFFASIGIYFIGSFFAYIGPYL